MVKPLVKTCVKLDEWHQLQQLPQVLTTIQLLYFCTSKAASKVVKQCGKIDLCRQLQQMTQVLTTSQQCQLLYFCTSKAVSKAAWQTRRVAPAPTNATGTSFQQIINSLSLCTFALVKPLVKPCGKLDEWQNSEAPTNTAGKQSDALKRPLKHSENAPFHYIYFRHMMT